MLWNMDRFPLPSSPEAVEEEADEDVAGEVAVGATGEDDMEEAVEEGDVAEAEADVAEVAEDGSEIMTRIRAVGITIHIINIIGYKKKY